MIRLEKVSKQFGERLLFSDISIEFKAGKTYALIGLSGSGKTTLLNMLAKLESYEGQIIYRGKNLKQYKTSDFFRKELGYLFQNFGLLENQTIDENLRLGLIGQKLKKDERQKRELEALKNVGLDYLDLGKRIFELSGGEAQRVALAKIILKNPPLILADEATAALDPETSKDIMTRLIALKNDHRVIVIATHNPIIWEMADEVISIHDL
ncbi:ATP-binding cassette domain-containing protein [Streptococcus intermedius]|jgi:ABC transporter, ATP-binding protein|uniref:ATP-binding cassette domain-containing protein n=1 Tax=Streptococcus intermedius TaxID=1338 RepID=UPI000C83B0B2|nr:ATP-binding cassette domain-containing protein [Streptococcus intermedius]PMR63849.1 peptide ABC transporter ATP-binding protein [Streptococcus intermedius]WOI90450.1 ATP-binding cassette domain-containing protein [Streptococcus intermedius]